MRKTTATISLAAGVLAVAFSYAVRAQERAGNDGPQYTNGTSLVRPTDYREWIFLSSGLGMTYETPARTRGRRRRSSKTCS